MVAVVNSAAELCVQIRAATPAGMPTGFVEPDPATSSGKLDRGGETGETRADDMHRAQPSTHKNPCRNTSQSLSGFDRLTRSAGLRHPERTRAESVAP